MNDYNKPPLGAEPAMIHAESRAKDLADAISRNICEDNFYYCEMWAEELIIQIQLAKRFKPIRFTGFIKANEESEESEAEE